MKRTFAKRGFMSFVAGFLLFGFMLLTAGRAEAQSSNWVNADEAKNRLMQTLNIQRGILSSNQPGTPAHTGAKTRAYFYKAIFSLVSDGTPLSEAVQGGLRAVAVGTDANNVPVSDNSTPQSPLQYLIDEATDLLTD